MSRAAPVLSVPCAPLLPPIAAASDHLGRSPHTHSPLSLLPPDPAPALNHADTDTDTLTPAVYNPNDISRQFSAMALSREGTAAHPQAGGAAQMEEYEFDFEDLDEEAVVHKPKVSFRPSDDIRQEIRPAEKASRPADKVSRPTMRPMLRPTAPASGEMRSLPSLWTAPLPPVKEVISRRKKPMAVTVKSSSVKKPKPSASATVHMVSSAHLRSFSAGVYGSTRTKHQHQQHQHQRIKLPSLHPAPVERYVQSAPAVSRSVNLPPIIKVQQQPPA